MTTHLCGFGFESSISSLGRFSIVKANEPGGTPDVDLRPSGTSLCLTFACRLAETLYVVGASPAVCLSARANVIRLLSEADESKFVSNAKAFCASFSARVFKTPGGKKFRLDGHFSRWVNAHLVRGRTGLMRIALLETIFVATKLLGHATDWMGIQAIRSHQKKTEESVPDDTYLPYLHRLSDALYHPLYCYMREAGEKPSHFAVASSTGSIESTRKVEGKAGRLVRTFEGVRETNTMMIACDWWLRQREGPPRIPIDEPRKKVADFFVGVDDGSGEKKFSVPVASRFDHSWPEEPDNGCLLEEPVPCGRSATILPSGHFVTPTTYDRPKTISAWQAHVIKESLLAQEPSDDVPPADRVYFTNVLEAGCKCRGVTKGDAASAVVAVNWQQTCFEGMRKLFGRFFPSLSGKITSIEISRLWVPDGVMRSSDFSSATDLLNPDLTNHMLINLTQGWPGQSIILRDNGDKKVYYDLIPKVYESSSGLKHWVKCTTRNVYYRVLTSAEEKKKVFKFRTVHIRLGDYTFPVEGESPTAWKRCGQLMGQATSFPLLCLSNLLVSFAAYCVAARALPRDFDLWLTMDFDFFRKRVRRALKEFHCIINGDDRLRCSLPSSDEERIFWSISTTVGLHRSPGKSHESDRFAVINAQRYALHLGEWVRADVLRVNLLFGIKKLVTERFCPAEVVTALFETCPFKWQERTMKLFLTRHGKQLDEDLGGRNLFLPIALGGMGQVRPECWINSIDSQQQAVASRLYHGMPSFEFHFGPVLGRLAPEPVKDHLPWDLPEAIPFKEGLWTQPMDSIASYKTRLRTNRGNPTFVRKREVQCPNGHWYEGSVCNAMDWRRGRCGAQGRVCPKGKTTLDLGSWHCPYNCLTSWEVAAGVVCDCPGAERRPVRIRRCDCCGTLSQVRYKFVERQCPDLRSLSNPRLVLGSRPDSVSIRDDVQVLMRKWQEERREWRGTILELGNTKMVKPYLDVDAVSHLFSSGGVVLPPVGVDGI